MLHPCATVNEHIGIFQIGNVGGGRLPIVGFSSGRNHVGDGHFITADFLGKIIHRIKARHDFKRFFCGGCFGLGMNSGGRNSSRALCAAAQQGGTQRDRQDAIAGKTVKTAHSKIPPRLQKQNANADGSGHQRLPLYPLHAAKSTAYGHSSDFFRIVPVAFWRFRRYTENRFLQG